MTQNACKLECTKIRKLMHLWPALMLAGPLTFKLAYIEYIFFMGVAVQKCEVEVVIDVETLYTAYGM